MDNSYTPWLKQQKTPIFFSTDAFYTIQHCFAKRFELSYGSNNYEISINAKKAWSIQVQPNHRTPICNATCSTRWEILSPSNWEWVTVWKWAWEENPSPAITRPNETVFYLSYFKSITLARKNIAILRPCRFQNNILLEHPNVLFHWALSVLKSINMYCFSTLLV